ncbi:DUF1145 domain-containing protein [Shewanella waksmanii]|uniref:DUF1145 domain-containing protein n=1 Tax=Shewanella waksmanii TaxID=213783 RepID=UPI00048D9B40|nr:DUF1145 domain-containing protein [Shewanella waksmanii]
MKLVIMIGKMLTLGAWLLMAINLIQPFEGEIGTILNILLAATALMHLFQVAIFHSLFKSYLTLKAADYLQVFAFGAFALIGYRQKVLSSDKHN